MQRPDLQPLLDSLPPKPGVYQFFDAEGEIIYVGKAGNLRSRVRSYFQESAQYDHRTQRIAARVEDIEWIVTRSDLEALLLEMNLIKRYRPKYNILLKDDKRYPYIKVTWRDRFPTVTSTRNVVQDGSRYFGPYASATAMRETLNTLRRVFPFLDCSRTITGNDERACLYYDIGMCLGPCIGAIDEEEYRAMIDRLCRFLQGDTGPVLEEMRAEMRSRAEKLEFEEAARLRDRIQSIEQVIERQRIIAPTLVDQDVVAIAREDDSAVAQVFFVRNGKLIGREFFQLEGTEDQPDDEVLSSFLKQFYDDTSLVPGEIVVPEHIAESEVIERWLAEKRGTRVRIAVPKRGRKRELVDVAVENACETLRALRVARATETDEEAARAAIDELAEALSLPRPPVRIETYDVSNLRGMHTVGSMVVFENAAPLKADYRHFRMKASGGGDDYAAMEEMLLRRLRRLVTFRDEGRQVGRMPGAFEKTPDLIIVDGGKGQLGVAVRVLQSLALDDIPAVALAKREDVLFRPGSPEPLHLARDSRALYLVQRARDEAHRFAIAYNRKLRRKKGLRSTLDEIPGIGTKRRRALLRRFGSLDAIREASIDDIAAVPGMTRRAAEQVKAYL